MKVVKNYWFDYVNNKIKKLPTLSNIKVTDSNPNRDFVVFGIIEDGGRKFMVFGDTLLHKSYIEEIVNNNFDLLNAPILRYIDDDKLWGVLFNFAIVERILP